LFVLRKVVRMKGWIVTALLVIGGYAVYQWLTQQRGVGAGARAAGTFNLNLGPLGVAAGINSNVDPTASGVPTFNTLAVANGHGDQVAAAYHDNSDATIPGSFQYTPAFGPNENQVGSGESPMGV
jgi:hypothetical protein